MGIVIVSLLHWIIAFGIVASSFYNAFVGQGLYGRSIDSIFSGNLKCLGGENDSIEITDGTFDINYTAEYFMD